MSVLLVCEAAMAFICCPIFGYIIDAAPTRQLPYLLGLILLGASMGILAAAHTIQLFILARILQGGATAMVAVAGLALLADSVAFDNLGQTIGYLGSAVALGFLLGPLLGGLVYDVAGYHAVFAMAFVIVGVDLVMRVSVIEKKVAERYLITEDGETPASPHQSQVSYQTFAEPAPPSPNNGKLRRPALWLIMQQPRVLISCWALLVQGLFYSAFDSVSHAYNSIANVTNQARPFPSSSRRDSAGGRSGQECLSSHRHLRHYLSLTSVYPPNSITPAYQSFPNIHRKPKSN